MPDYLPAHHELVLASGAAEIGGALGVIAPRTRRAAGLWLAATLVAVFPANLHMALHAERYPGFAPALLWGRLLAAAAGDLVGAERHAAAARRRLAQSRRNLTTS